MSSNRQKIDHTALRLRYRTPKITNTPGPTRILADYNPPKLEAGPFECQECGLNWKFDKACEVLEVLECPECADKMLVRTTKAPEEDINVE